MRNRAGDSLDIDVCYRDINAIQVTQDFDLVIDIPEFVSKE